tara:strand:- start:3432 stop:4193 length:762 start_codon:yes stop_codon:yes gene_type:complete
MIVDILVLVVILISALISFLRGFIREILTILGIVGGIIAAYIGGPLLIPQVQEWIGYDPDAKEPQELLGMIPYEYVASGLAYGGLFIVFVIILSILSHFMAEGAKSVGLGAMDRTLGVVFGIARGILLVGLLYLPFYYHASEDDKESFFEGSKAFVYMEVTSGWLGSFIPEIEEEQIQETVEEIKKSGARETLENLDLLNKDEDSDKQSKESGEQENQKNPDGYTEDFREKMDELFELNETAPEAGSEYQYNE